MTDPKWLAGVSIAALTTGLAAVCQSQEPAAVGSPSRPAEIDNLVHPPELETVDVGSLGRLVKEGHGPDAMVLLSGASFGASAWRTFMQRNLERYTMFAFTPAGFDGTPPPEMPEVDTIPDLIWTRAFLDAIVARLRKEGAKNVIVVGHHMMGDYYALRLALEQPDLVRALILSSHGGTWPMAGAGSGAPSPAQRWEQVRSQVMPTYRHLDRAQWNQNAWSAQMLSRDEERGALLYEHQINTPRSTQLRYFLEYACEDLTGRLGELSQPALLLDAYRDLETAFETVKEPFAAQLGSEEKAREQFERMLTAQFGSLDKARETMSRTKSHELSEALPDAEVRTIKDAAAFLMDDQAEEFDRLVASFVAGLDP